MNMSVSKSDKRMLIVLDEALIRDAKVHAAKEGITLRKLTALALQDYLLRHKKKAS